MAKRRKRKAKNNSIIFIILALAGIVAAVFGLADQDIPFTDYVKDVFSEQDTSEFSVHFIDVGQGDCTLIRTQDTVILVDAGENDLGSKVVNYLQKQNIKKIDLLIGTHPHSDHIGGLDTVIDNFEVDTVLMPEIPESIIPTTKTYLDVLTSIDNKNLSITNAEVGEIYSYGEMDITVLGPVQAYMDLNDLSVAVRVTYKDISIFLSGDAEEQAEADILHTGYELESVIFKAGHHGSKTSNTYELVQAVQPQYTVFSVGKNNSYGHPVEEVVKRIEDAGSSVYRTDEQGSVVFQVNDGELSVRTEK